MFTSRERIISMNEIQIMLIKQYFEKSGGIRCKTRGLSPQTKGASDEAVALDNVQQGGISPQIRGASDKTVSTLAQFLGGLSPQTKGAPDRRGRVGIISMGGLSPTN